MLTKTDLKQIDKVIGKRIREEVEAEGKNTRDQLKSDIISLRMRLREEIAELANRTKNLEVGTNNLKKEMIKGFKNVNTRLEKTTDFLDRDNLAIKKRVQIIEKHLHLPPAS